MDKDQFRNYLTKVFPVNTFGDNEDFDFVLCIESSFSKTALPEGGPSSDSKRISSSSSESFQHGRRSTFSRTAQGGSISSSIRNSKPVKRFLDFLAEQKGIPYDIKTELKQILSDPNWTVYNPRGDGFCTIHAIYEDLGTNHDDINFLVNELYRAMKTYIETTSHEILIRADVKFHTIGKYSFRDQNAQETKERLSNYVKNGTLPHSIQEFYQKRKNKNTKQIDIQELYDILERNFKNRTGPFQKPPHTISIEDVKNILLTKQDFEEQKEEVTKEVLKDLKKSNDLGTEIVQYFPYITGRNILYITVDKESITPIRIEYYEGKRGSSKTPQNTILFNCSGHTVLLQNTEEIKNELVKPNIPKFSAEQITILHNLGVWDENEIANMTRDDYNEIIGKR